MGIIIKKPNTSPINMCFLFCMLINPYSSLKSHFIIHPKRVTNNGRYNYRMPDEPLNLRFSRGARIEEISREVGHYRLEIPAGQANAYRLAQLDDYAKLDRNKFPLHPPLTLTLSARASSDSIPGTWGFGLWNHPFGLSLGFGGNAWQLPSLPNAVWFFGASEENYLSFKDASTTSGLDMGEKNIRPTRPPVANGFIAQTFRAPRFHLSLILAGLALPFSRIRTRRMLSRVIEEDGVQLWSQGARSRNIEMQTHQHAGGVQTLSVNPIQWHRYRIDWSLKRVSFEVDEVRVFESSVSPNPPLGLVIWIDNQFAAFTPEGKIGFGVLANPEPAWLEIKDIEITSGASIA